MPSEPRFEPTSPHRSTGLSDVIRRIEERLLGGGEALGRAPAAVRAASAAAARTANIQGPSGALLTSISSSGAFAEENPAQNTEVPASTTASSWLDGYDLDDEFIDVGSESALTLKAKELDNATRFAIVSVSEFRVETGYLSRDSDVDEDSEDTVLERVEQLKIRQNQELRRRGQDNRRRVKERHRRIRRGSTLEVKMLHIFFSYTIQYYTI